MPNQLAKDLELMFEDYVESYDAACVISNEVSKTYPSGQKMQRAAGTFYRPQRMGAEIIEGLDLTASTPMDTIQRFIPSTFRAPDNVLYTYNALEARDPATMREQGRAAAVRLAAQIDKNIYEAVAKRAAIVHKKVGALTWDDGGTAEALMISRGIGAGRQRKLFMNAFSWRDITKDLGNRAYLQGPALSAYERSKVPPIAMFDTFRTDNQVNLAAIGTVSGTTVNGTQSFTPSSMTGDVPTDNRQMTLVVAGANIANTKNGDAFQIANVNAVHQIDKTDTGQPLTFRILSGGGTANLVVTPAIIATGQYQNVSAVAAGGAAITFLNTVTTAVNPFWADGVVELAFGKLMLEQDQGLRVMTATTKQGVPLTMSYGTNLRSYKTEVRFSTLYAVTVLEPEQCGIIIANQT